MKIMKSSTFNFQFEIEETLQLTSDLQYNLENEPSIDFEHYSTYAITMENMIRFIFIHEIKWISLK